MQPYNPSQFRCGQLSPFPALCPLALGDPLEYKRNHRREQIKGRLVQGRLVHFRLFVLLRVVSDPQEYKRNHRREQIKGQLRATIQSISVTMWVA
jgi:hypothetical protein